jgi:hypothetical protein
MKWEIVVGVDFGFQIKGIWWKQRNYLKEVEISF